MICKITKFKKKIALNQLKKNQLGLIAPTGGKPRLFWAGQEGRPACRQAGGNDLKDERPKFLLQKKLFRDFCGVAFDDSVAQTDDAVGIFGDFFFVGYEDYGVAVGVNVAK